jgi:hypothetical protein
MFDRPDADYIQDLLAGYILGNLEGEELSYLQRQIARDPEVRKTLRQLQQALNSLAQGRTEGHTESHHGADSASTRAITQPLAASSHPHSAYGQQPMYGLHHFSDVGLPAPTRGLGIPHRRTARRIVWLSSLAAIGAIAMSLPWLKERSDFIQRSLGITTLYSPEQPASQVTNANAQSGPQSGTQSGPQSGAQNSKAQNSKAALASPKQAADWLSLKALLDDHSKATGLLISGNPMGATDPQQIMMVVNQVFSTADSLPTPKDPATQLIAGSRIEFANVEGIRLSYATQTQQQLSLYWLKPNDAFKLPAQTQLYLESPNGPNLILWRNAQGIYGIAANLPIQDLKVLAQTIQYQ